MTRPKYLLRRGNQWVILAGFQLGILLDLIFMARQGN